MLHELRIETQDAIFHDQDAKRVVEVGATTTLATMARRTLASKYRTSDATRLLKRHILALAEDEKEICYQVDPVQEKVEETEQSAKMVELDLPATAIGSVAAPATGVVMSVTLAADSPVTATDIVRALVAQKLRKPLQDVPLGKSIKELSGGKIRLWKLLTNEYKIT